MCVCIWVRVWVSLFTQTKHSNLSYDEFINCVPCISFEFIIDVLFDQFFFSPIFGLNKEKRICGSTGNTVSYFPLHLFVCVGNTHLHI